MRNLWKEDLTLQEWNEEFKKALKKLNKPKCSKLTIVLSVAAMLVVLGALVFVLIKFHNGKPASDEFEDDCDCDDNIEEIDENGCRYTDDEDFEEAK